MVGSGELEGELDCDLLQERDRVLFIIRLSMPRTVPDQACASANDY